MCLDEEDSILGFYPFHAGVVCSLGVPLKNKQLRKMMKNWKNQQR